MNKRAFLLVFLLIGPVLFASCIVHKIYQEKLGAIENWRNSGATIYAVQKTSGEHVEFSPKSPAHIKKDQVVGSVLEETLIERSKLKGLTVDSKGKLLEITPQDGKTYQVVYGRIEGDKVRYVTNSSPMQTVSIPLSEIELIWVKRINAIATLTTNLVIVSAVALIGVVAFSHAAAPPPPPTGESESCPFIYSFDGQQYMFDAEPYGGSICQGLERTEWLGLDHLSSVDGQYKILVSNELDETQFTNELKLLVVDHREGERVVPDIQGRLHTISDPVPPITAHDQKGKNIQSLISQEDSTFWVSPLDGKNPDRAEDLKDELTIEFPKPADVKQAKLVANAWTTVRGSQVAKTFLSLHGNKTHEWLQEINNFGPAYHWIQNWYLREDLYLLKIWVETKEGWRVKGMIYGGGPFVAKNKTYPLDISDVPGNTLKIKLTPASGFWMIDYLATDYSEDVPLEASELSAIKALDSQGRDVLDRLAAADDLYLVMANKGDYAEVTYQAPPLKEGLARSFIIKAKGYYDIHLEAAGDPQTEALEKMNQPGYSIQLAMKEFLKAEDKQSGKTIK